MAPRDLIALKLDRETPKTILSALDALDEINCPSRSPHAPAIAEMRKDFQIELQLLLNDETQGVLF